MTRRSATAFTRHEEEVRGRQEKKTLKLGSRVFSESEDGNLDSESCGDYDKILSMQTSSAPSGLRHTESAFLPDQLVSCLSDKQPEL